MSLFTLYGLLFSHFQKGKKTGHRICSCVCHRTPERQRAPTLKNRERNDRKGEQEWYPQRVCALFAAQEALFTGCRRIRAKLKGSLSDLQHSLGRVWMCCCDHFYFEAQDQPLPSSCTPTCRLPTENFELKREYAPASPACIIAWKARCVPAKHGPHMRRQQKFSAL